MDIYEVKNLWMEWWRWNTCIKALQTEKYQPIEAGDKGKKKSNLKNIGPKRATKKEEKKKIQTDRPMFWHPKGNTTSFYFRPNARANIYQSCQSPYCTSCMLGSNIVDTSPKCGSHGLWLESRHDTNVFWQDINIHLPHSTQVS